MNATTTTYRCRAESEFDARALRSLLSPWLDDFRMHQVATTEFGERVVLPDVHIQFSVKPTGPTYGEILWLVDDWYEGDVLARTLAPAKQYTEKPTDRAPFEKPAQNPRPEIHRMVDLQVLEGFEVLLRWLQEASAKSENAG